MGQMSEEIMSKSKSNILRTAGKDERLPESLMIL